MTWLNDAVIYQIFIDRFAGYDAKKDWRRPEFMGGNIRGIINKFDYIKDLGVNTIWLSPFYECDAFHGYGVTDFTQMDERFGSEDDLRELIKLSHDNGLRIIADIVPNHVSNEHPFFRDAVADPGSPYRHWFTFKKWPTKYLRFQTFDTMPKLNLKSKDAFAHMHRAASKWLEMGLDGYRVDHVIGLSNKTVKKLFGELKREFPERVFFGEGALFGADGNPAGLRSERRGLNTIGIPKKRRAWLLKSHGLEGIARNYIGLLDGMLDFHFAHYMAQYARAKDERGRQAIAKKLAKHGRDYPDNFSNVLFLDNHDLTRYLYRVNGNKQRLLSAFELMFSAKGAKVMYYGTEVGVTQETSFANSIPNDIQARMPMPWKKADQDRVLLEQIKKIITKKS